MIKFLSMRVFLYCIFLMMFTVIFTTKQNFYIIYIFIWIFWMFELYLIHYKKINNKTGSKWLNNLWIVIVLITFITIQLYLEFKL